MKFLRTRKSRAVAIGAVAVLCVNGTAVAPIVSARIDAAEAQTMGYKQRYGHWDVITLPTDQKISAVHAAMLNNGKILITAGSANNATTFAAGTFVTEVYDPTTNTGKMIDTPTDMFCGGQAFLPDGRLLIAGGTQNYEILKPDAKKAGGVVTITSNDTKGTGRLIGANTVLLGANGQKYVTDASVSLPPATLKTGNTGAKYLAPGRATVWAFAVNQGNVATYKGGAAAPMHFSIAGLPTADQAKLTLTSGNLAIAKHDFEGSAYSYIFDPDTETYLRVADMTIKRWYPTLTTLSNGSVLAVSGLDGNSHLIAPAHSAEQFDTSTESWTARPDLTQQFPTYPSLFQTAKPNVVFYSGSNTGYGDDALNQKTPGFWNLTTNSYTPVRGLREANQTDSSGSAWLGPVQNQRIALVGGGLAGETLTSTDRIDTVDLSAANPTWTAGPSLRHGTRYPLLVDLPDDNLFITGGSGAYRGENATSNHDAAILHPDTRQLTRAARPHVERSYHSEALLLPDGRVLTMGSNPLYSDAANSKKAPFETRLELYTPAYLYHGPQPVLESAPAAAPVGSTVTVTSPQAGQIAKVRLMKASTVTHAQNLSQRDVAVPFTASGDRLTLSLPKATTILPAGYYMLFLVNKAGVPSVAKWVLITS